MHVSQCYSPLRTIDSNLLAGANPFCRAGNAKRRREALQNVAARHRALVGHRHETRPDCRAKGQRGKGFARIGHRERLPFKQAASNALGRVAISGHHLKHTDTYAVTL